MRYHVTNTNNPVDFPPRPATRSDIMTQDEDPQVEKIYELNQEIIRLRGQITYLQEELAKVEDENYKITDCYENKIADLEQQLGDALYGSWRANKGEHL